MDHGFLVVISFLMGSIVVSNFMILIYLRNVRRDLSSIIRILDLQIMKVDSIAEWLIDQDPDCDPGDLVEFPVDDFEITDYPHSIGNVEDQFGSAEEWKQFYQEDVNNE